MQWRANTYKNTTCLLKEVLCAVYALNTELLTAFYKVTHKIYYGTLKFWYLVSTCKAVLRPFVVLIKLYDLYWFYIYTVYCLHLFIYNVLSIYSTQNEQARRKLGSQLSARTRSFGMFFRTVEDDTASQTYTSKRFDFLSVVLLKDETKGSYGSNIWDPSWDKAPPTINISECPATCYNDDSTRFARRLCLRLFFTRVRTCRITGFSGLCVRIGFGWGGGRRGGGGSG